MSCCGLAAKRCMQAIRILRPSSCTSRSARCRMTSFISRISSRHSSSASLRRAWRACWQSIPTRFWSFSRYSLMRDRARSSRSSKALICRSRVSRRFSNTSRSFSAASNAETPSSSFWRRSRRINSVSCSRTARRFSNSNSSLARLSLIERSASRRASSSRSFACSSIFFCQRRKSSHPKTKAVRKPSTNVIQDSTVFS